MSRNPHFKGGSLSIPNGLTFLEENFELQLVLACLPLKVFLPADCSSVITSAFISSSISSLSNAGESSSPSSRPVTQAQDYSLQSPFVTIDRIHRQVVTQSTLCLHHHHRQHYRCCDSLLLDDLGKGLKY